MKYGTLDEGAGEGSGPPETSFKSCDGTEHTRDEYGNIEDELIKGISNVEGTLSMANSGEPDTGGSQFFINVKDNKNLGTNLFMKTHLVWLVWIRFTDLFDQHCCD